MFSMTLLMAMTAVSAKKDLVGVLLNEDPTTIRNLRSPMLQHYGHPPDGCDKDEAALRIQNVPGMICSPHCADVMPCPTDLPDGVSAQPNCAIQDAEGHHYCVLICDPNSPGQCGDMNCQPVQGLGVCTWEE